MDVVLILEKLAELQYIRLSKISNNYYQMYCPFHNDGQEKKPSFGVLLHEEIKNGQKYPEGWAHCFSCKYVNTLPGMISDLLKSKNISMSGLDWLVANIPGFEAPVDFENLVPPDLMSAITNKFALDYIVKHTSSSDDKYIPESELAKYRYTVPYMYERKLTDDIISKYDIGVDMNWVPPGRKQKCPCITFPVRDKEGNTLFLCRRSIKGKLYNYPTGVTKPLYGVDMIPSDCKSVIICESCINALTCVRYGYYAVALMGTGNSYQLQQLKELGVNEFVLCLDGDDAGRKGAEKLKHQLKSVALVWTMHLPDGKDINDCTESEFRELYADRD